MIGMKIVRKTKYSRRISSKTSISFIYAQSNSLGAYSNLGEKLKESRWCLGMEDDTRIFACRLPVNSGKSSSERSGKQFRVRPDICPGDKSNEIHYNEVKLLLVGQVSFLCSPSSFDIHQVFVLERVAKKLPDLIFQEIFERACNILRWKD